MAAGEEGITLTHRLRILMLTTQLGYGGAETSFIRLANYLAQSMEVTVALFTRDYGLESYAKGHAPLHAKVVLLDEGARGGRVARWLHRIRRVRALKSRSSFTISFLSGPNLVNALSGYPWQSCVSVRGSRRFDPVAPRWQRWIFRYVLDPITYLRAGYVVPVSPGLKHELGRWNRYIFPIPPFIDRAALEQALHEPLSPLVEQLRGQRVIVAVGRLSVEKGFQHLIRVFAAVAAQSPGAKLLLVGDGPMRQTLRTLCQSHGLAMDVYDAATSAVIFVGYQQNVMPLIALGKVFALTSVTEGFPSVLLEAMVARVPVIASDAPWGARAILDAYEEGAPEPYPTHTARCARYGTLMPRIGDPAYHDVWVQVLMQHLEGNIPAIANASEILERFSQEVVCEGQWQVLIQRLALV